MITAVVISVVPSISYNDAHNLDHEVRNGDLVMLLLRHQGDTPVNGALSEGCAEKRQAGHIGLKFQQVFAVGIPVNKRIERRLTDLDGSFLLTVNANAERCRA